MAIRTLKYTVTANDITPNDIQWGGIQYEDNATEIIYEIETDFLEKLKALNDVLLFRIDFNSATGGYNPSENLDESNLRREIPYQFTCNGGNITVTLVVTATDKDGKATNVVLARNSVITFDASPRNAESEKVVVNSLSAMEDKLRKDLEDGAFKGEKGDAYVLTDADINEIADIVKQEFIDVSEVAQ